MLNSPNGKLFVYFAELELRNWNYVYKLQGGFELAVESFYQTIGSRMVRGGPYMFAPK